MRILSTKVHGVLDYTVGGLLIAAPWLLGFVRGGAETWVPVVLGVSALIYSLITNYELGMAKVLSMPAHLTLDFFSGVILAASPWLFGFSEYVYIPHLVLGIFEMIAAVTTDPIPRKETNRQTDVLGGHTRHAH